MSTVSWRSLRHQEPTTSTFGRNTFPRVAPTRASAAWTRAAAAKTRSEPARASVITSSIRSTRGGAAGAGVTAAGAASLGSGDEAANTAPWTTAPMNSAAVARCGTTKNQRSDTEVFTDFGPKGGQFPGAPKPTVLIPRNRMPIATGAPCLSDPKRLLFG